MKTILPQEDDPQFQMAPMIDMVFLLLVFFMIASRFSQVQNVQLEIPTASKAVVPKERPSRFVVNILADGTYFAGSAPVSSIEDLKTIVKVEKDANPELKIYLRADRATEHRHVRKVMGAMGELGIDDFIFGAFIPD